ncbi:hypothetical protein N7540_002153 [Penicillium herquei]|nr:hypothetical protein N7540_002153 [Penicillium herquei]
MSRRTNVTRQAIQAGDTDRDWSIDPIESTEPETQMTNFPNTAVQNITSTAGSLLSSPKDYNKWVQIVLRTIRPLGFERLLNIGLLRPKRTDERAPSWKKSSLAIGSWLLSTLSPDIMTQLKYQEDSLIFADEIYEAIHDFMIGYGPYADLEHWNSLRNLKVDEFDLPTDFIDQLMTQTAELRDRGFTVSPYGTLMTILYELSDDYPTIKELTCKKLEEKEIHASTFTNKDLRREVNSILQQLKLVQKSKAGPGMSATSEKFTEFKNKPPPGVTDEDHVTAQKKKGRPKGKCGHCGYGSHAAETCYCLRPDLRSPGWRPPRGIWAYKPHDVPTEATAGDVPDPPDTKPPDTANMATGYNDYMEELYTRDFYA